MGTLKGLLLADIIAVADADGYDRIWRQIPRGILRGVTLINVTRAFDCYCELMPPGLKENAITGYFQMIDSEPGDANENVIWHGEFPIGNDWSLQGTIKCTTGDRIVMAALVEQP